ncbi:MAG: alpha/beta fold hydrolase, partial [Planctomycetota bacterium]
SDLPHQVRARFPTQDVELLNFYGPTETAIEATYGRVSLDHDPKRPVSIGRPIDNVQVVIVDDCLNELPHGLPGQIAISGAGLAVGYLGNPDLTSERFVELSFPIRRAYLTGDVGRIRADGQLDFLGRLDGQVKVRGYRIELEEVETRIMEQPGVLDAACCVVGEGAAAILVAFVVGRAEAWDLQLPKFKRPSRVHQVDAVPRTNSGKVDRRALRRHAESTSGDQDVVPAITDPVTPLETFLVEAWRDVLNVPSVSTDENFFDSGGSSLLAATLTSQLSERLGVRVPPAIVFDLLDIRGMAGRLSELYPSQIEAAFGVESLTGDLTSIEDAHPLIAAWQPKGPSPPLFMVHPPGGIVVCYRELAECLEPEMPLYAIRARGLHGDEDLPASVEEMADDYVRAVTSTRPEGSVVLGGWSLGGIIAVEVARRLQRAGRHVERLLLIDTTLPTSDSSVGLEYGIDLNLDELSRLRPEEQLPFLWEHAKKLGVLDDQTHPDVVQQMLGDLQRLFHHHVGLASRYQVPDLQVPITLFRPTEVPVETMGPLDRGWSEHAEQVSVVQVPGHHHSMLSTPHVQEIGKHLLSNLDAQRV